MLERQDLEMIRLIVREEVGESENRMTAYVGEKITESEERMKNYVGEKITESEERMKNYVGEKITESEERMKTYIHEEIGHSENRVLGELDRVDMRLSLRMELIETRMSDICEYYRIRRLDDTNASYLLRLIDGLTRRVEVLETKVA